MMRREALVEEYYSLDLSFAIVGDSWQSGSEFLSARVARKDRSHFKDLVVVGFRCWDLGS